MGALRDLKFSILLDTLGWSQLSIHSNCQVLKVNSEFLLEIAHLLATHLGIHLIFQEL